MDEREPTRLFEDPEMSSALRRDLQTAQTSWQHAGDAEAALARFSTSAAATTASVSAAKLAFFVGGGIALLGVLTALVVLRPSQAPRSAPRARAPEVAASVPEEAPVPVAAPEPVAAPPPAPPPRERVARAAPQAPPEAEETPSALALLERETQLMSEQRREARSGDPRRALEIARQAAREFPAGHFRVEREAWSIIALARAGQGEQARARAERFLAQHPRSPQAGLVQRTVGLP